MPHKAASFNTMKRAKITIICIFIISIAFNLQYIFITDNIGWICLADRATIFGQIAYWISFIVSYAFPFVSILAMNSVIIHTLPQRLMSNITISDGQGQNVKNIQQEDRYT